MAQIYRTVVGNDSPDIVFTCQRNGTAINLTGATVTLAITNERTGSVTNAVQTCSITTAAQGIVTYTPAVADFPSEGRYIGDVKIVHISGKTEKLYELLLILARA